MAALAAFAGLVPTNLPACGPDVALEVSVERLNAEPERYLGRCVTVAGPTWESAMYSGIEGYYLTRRRGPNGQVPAANRAHRIGLYFSEDRTDHPEEAWTAFRHFAVTGIVDSCERMAGVIAAEKEESERRRRERGAVGVFSMLAGYCHYHDGAVIWVAASELDPDRRFARLTGEAARNTYGSLVMAPSRWTHTSGLRSLAEAYRGAIADGNRERISDLQGQFGASEADFGFLLAEPNSPFRELRIARPNGQIAVLLEAVDRHGIPAESRPDRNAILCFCRGEDCAGLWPITQSDTFPLMEHPYVCVRVSEDDTGAVSLDPMADWLNGPPQAPLVEPEN